MSRKSTYLSQVDRGLKGRNIGLPNGLGSMNNYIYGINEGRYYLVGGESGSGKTTFTDFGFVLTPYFATKEIEQFSDYKLSVNYWSLEQSRQTKEGKWASHIIYKKHGIWIPPALALGKTKTLLTADQYNLCKEANDDLDELFDSCVTMIDTSSGPSSILRYLLLYGQKKGKWTTVARKDSEGNMILNKEKKPILDITGWEANDLEERHVFLIDHIAYAEMEKRTLKENIDTISRLFVRFRELTTSWTFVVIQQFNTELGSIERQKFKKSALAPQRMDFGDSKYTFQDADVVFGLLNPYKYDIRDDFHGYKDIEKFGGLAIWAFLIKNRHEGTADRAIPFFMDPIQMSFEEIPEMTPDHFDLCELGIAENPLQKYYDTAEAILELKNKYN